MDGELGVAGVFVHDVAVGRLAGVKAIGVSGARLRGAQ